jgi:hypothetical protein
MFDPSLLWQPRLAKALDDAGPFRHECRIAGARRHLVVPRPEIWIDSKDLGQCAAIRALFQDAVVWDQFIAVVRLQSKAA